MVKMVIQFPFGMVHQVVEKLVVSLGGKGIEHKADGTLIAGYSAVGGDQALPDAEGAVAHRLPGHQVVGEGRVGAASYARHYEVDRHDQRAP